MKKLFALLLTVSMTFLLCSCGTAEYSKDESYVQNIKNLVNTSVEYTRTWREKDNSFDISNTESSKEYIAILDKLCQLELDGVKAQVDAKNDRIAELQTQLNMAALRESQTAQNAFIQQGFSNEVDQLYNRLNNCPVPTTPVYGRTPIFTCNQNTCGCGCGMA